VIDGHVRERRALGSNPRLDVEALNVDLLNRRVRASHAVPADLVHRPEQLDEVLLRIPEVDAQLAARPSLAGPLDLDALLAAELLLRGAIGKALLMGRSRADVDRILGAPELDAVTTSTILDRDELWAQLASAAERGFAVSEGEWRPGRFGVAAPVVSNGHTVASVGLIGLIATSSPDGVGEIIRSAALDISARLAG